MAVYPRIPGSAKTSDFIPSPFHQAVYAELSKNTNNGITCETIWCGECGRERYGIGTKRNGEIVKDYLCLPCRLPE